MSICIFCGGACGRVCRGLGFEKSDGSGNARARVEALEVENTAASLPHLAEVASGPSDAKFDRVAYQREYMRGMRDRQKEQALYRCFGEAGELLYVGISLYAAKRLQQHAPTEWFNYVTTIKIERFTTRDEAMSAEDRAIRTESPLYNRTVNLWQIGRTGTRCQPGCTCRRHDPKKYIRAPA